MSNLKHLKHEFYLETRTDKGYEQHRIAYEWNKGEFHYGDWELVKEPCFFETIDNGVYAYYPKNYEFPTSLRGRLIFIQEV